MEEATGTSSIDTTEEGYIAVGYIGEYGTEQNLLLVKMDLLGNVVWNHTIGGEYGDAGVWIQRSGDKHYYITGYRDEDGTEINDMWLLKIKID